ncbi:MAG: hypothetical protein GC180_13345 [Bacteroidetes bacterium]|nr:hypothetical protein [Bacteroidota bacterium]
MNFLSHHFFYALDDAWHNTGLILPDWSRNAKGRRKLEWKKSEGSPEFHFRLWSGCQKHYEADEWFHDCHYFLACCEQVESDLGLAQQGGLFLGQRKWFLAHLLAEMLLDRLIIEKYPGALDSFYSDLIKVPFRDLKDFLLTSGKIDMANFERSHRGFIESEFIRYYIDDRGLAESLSRVVQRTGQVPLTSDELTSLTLRMPYWIDYASQLKKPHQMARLL